MSGRNDTQTRRDSSIRQMRGENELNFFDKQALVSVASASESRKLPALAIGAQLSAHRIRNANPTQVAAELEALGVAAVRQEIILENRAASRLRPLKMEAVKGRLE